MSGLAAARRTPSAARSARTRARRLRRSRPSSSPAAASASARSPVALSRALGEVANERAVRGEDDLRRSSVLGLARRGAGERLLRGRDARGHLVDDPEHLVDELLELLVDELVGRAHRLGEPDVVVLAENDVALAGELSARVASGAGVSLNLRRA